MEDRKDICEGYERDSVQQLDKLAKDKNERFSIYPLTYIQAVYDARTKERLDSILWKCNNVYLPWMGSAGDTRIQLPFWMRRKGIYITYKDLDGNVITERCINDDCVADHIFRKDENWILIGDDGINPKVYFNRYGYNVTVFGLKGGVHTLVSAIKDVPPRERILGQKITFAQEGENWVTYQFQQLSLSGYENPSNWKLVDGIQQIEGDINITNHPDEEDITTDGGNRLKLADKEYDTSAYSGMGRIYLRKNIQDVEVLPTSYLQVNSIVDAVTDEVAIKAPTDTELTVVIGRDGKAYAMVADDINKYTIWDAYGEIKASTEYMDSSYILKHNTYYLVNGFYYVWDGSLNEAVLQTEKKNVLTQEMLDKPNTIYVVQYDFDLNFDWNNYDSAHNYAVKIPEGSILKYEGGSISNGLLNFADDTYIEGPERGDCMKYGSYGYIDKPRYHVKNDMIVVNRLSEIFNSYYKQNEKFHYGHKNTLLRQDFQIEEPWYMNCSSFSAAMILGIPFENSKYNGKDNILDGSGWYDKDFYQWLTSGDNEHFYKYSHNLARYLNDRGYTLDESENDINNLQPGDVLFVNIENKPAWNNPFYYMGIDHSATFAYRVNDNKFAVWEVWGEAQVFGIGFYDKEWFDKHIRLIARVPRSVGDNPVLDNIAYNPYNTYEKTTEANDDFQNRRIATISVSEPIEAYKYYTVVLKMKFMTERSKAFPTLIVSSRTNFSYSQYVNRPNDDVYFIPFCFKNREIENNNTPSPIDRICTTKSLGIDVGWIGVENIKEEHVKIEYCFIFKGIISEYNNRIKYPILYPVSISNSEYEEYIKGINTKWTRLPDGIMLNGYFNIQNEDIIKGDPIIISTINIKNKYDFKYIIQGHTINERYESGVIFLDYREGVPVLKIKNLNGGLMHYFDILLPLNIINRWQ